MKLLNLSVPVGGGTKPQGGDKAMGDEVIGGTKLQGDMGAGGTVTGTGRWPRLPIPHYHWVLRPEGTSHNKQNEARGPTHLCPPPAPRPR